MDGLAGKRVLPGPPSDELPHTEAVAGSRNAAPGPARQVDLSSITASAWNAVAPERRTPMQQHLWVSVAAETLSPRRAVRVVLVGSLKAPLALAPLMRSHSPGRMKLLGAEELAEPVEVLYSSKDTLARLAEGLAATRMPLSFGHYLADTPFLVALKRAYRGRGLVIARPLPARACPSIALDPSWIEPESHFTARRRSDFRRMQRTAEKIGRVEIEILTPRADAAAALLDEAIEIEHRSWKSRAGTSLAENEQQARFIRRYGALACDAGILRLCFLRIDGRAIAMQIALETEGRFWLLKIGYDEAFKRCSPGNLLLRETISYAARSGLKSYEFLGKEAEWTTLWTQQARPVVALRTYPFNAAGLFAGLADGIHMARQRIAAAWLERKIKKSQVEADA